MSKYLIAILLLGNITLSHASDLLFKGQSAPTNMQELYDQSLTFLTAFRPFVNSPNDTQEKFFEANKEAHSLDSMPTEEMKDSIYLVADSSSQNAYTKHFKTKWIPSSQDMETEKWIADLYIKGIDFSILQKNLETLATHVEDIKPNPPSFFMCVPFYLLWQKLSFKSSLKTIKTDLQNLLPANFFEVTVGDTKLTTTTDAQYGIPSKPIVYANPFNGLGPTHDFVAYFSLVPDCSDGHNGAEKLPGLFSWDSLPYAGGTIISQAQHSNSTVDFTQGITNPGTGGVTLTQQSEGYAMQCFYKCKLKRINMHMNMDVIDMGGGDGDDDIGIQTRHRNLTLKDDPTAPFVARSKLLEFIKNNIAVSK